MFTENILQLFRDNLIMETLHLPHNTKSAKVIAHVDLDGVCSAISMVQQLIKQGIKKERINVEFAQYGDEERQGRKFTKKFEKKTNSQWVGVVDFAKYPKGKIWEIFNKIMSFKGDKVLFVSFVNSRDFSKIKEEEFKEIFKKTFSFKQTKYIDDDIGKLFDACKAYCLYGKKENQITVNNIENYSIQLVKPDFGSDHHSNEQGALSAAQRGDLAVNSPSEVEFFANKYTPGIWSQEDLKAISAVDSADFSKEELENSIFLRKNFKGPDRKRNLAMLIAIVYDNLCKKDENVAKWIILNTQPSLVSLYNNVKQGAKLNGERLRMLDAIKNGDINTAKGIAESLPKILNKNWAMPDGSTYKDRNGKTISRAETLDDFRTKNQEHLKNAKTGYKTRQDKQELENIKGKRDKDSSAKRKLINSKKGKISHYKNFSIFDGKDTHTQYSRHFPNLIADEQGNRQPYVMRFWNNMFQISLNPIYKKGCQQAGINDDLVDFSKVGEEVLQTIKQYLIKKGLSNFSAERIYNIMKEKNGGHKGGIWTFSGFENIKPPSKDLDGEQYYKDKRLIDKANEIDVRRGGAKQNTVEGKINVARKYIHNAPDRFEEKEKTVVAYWDQVRDECIRLAKLKAIEKTNELYPPKKEGFEALSNSRDDMRLGQQSEK